MEIGYKQGRLKIIGPKIRIDSRWRFLTRCDCGSEQFIREDALAGNVKSCGCLKKELEDGRSHLPEYRVWKGLRKRCRNPYGDDAKRYKERGIKCCERWLESFHNFYADMGPRPSAKHSIDRIDNDGNYEPSNCEWGTKTQQAKNRRSTIFVEVAGKRMCFKDAAKLLPVVRETAYKKMNQTGMKHQEVIDFYIGGSA